MSDYDTHDMNFRSYKGYSIVRRDPFGLWVIKDSNNRQVTNESYTMVKMARQAIDMLPKERTDKKRKD